MRVTEGARPAPRRRATGRLRIRSASSSPPARLAARALAVLLCAFLARPAHAADDPLGRLEAEVLKHGRSFRGLAPLVRLRRAAPWASRARLRAALERLSGSPRLAPELRYHVARMLADLDRRAGRLEQAQTRLGAAGVLDRGWWVAAGGDGVALRNVSRPWPGGRVPLGALLSLDAPGSVAVARNRVRVRRSTTVRLTTLPGEDAVFSVNGTPAPGGVARLRAGWNGIALESRRPRDGRWTVTVRMAGPDGRPMPVEAMGYTAGFAPLPTGRVARARPAPDLVARWKAERSAALAHDRAVVLDYYGLSGWGALAAAITARPSPAQLLDAARLASASHTALAMLDRLLRMEPRSVAGRLERARRLRERGRQLAALDAVREILRDAPADVGARVTEAALLIELRAVGAAQAQLEQLAREHGDVPAVLRELAHTYQQRGLLERARDAFGRLAGLDDSGGEVIYQQLEIARGLGDGVEAERLARRLVARRPDVPGHRVTVARLLDELGRPDAVRAVLQRALALFPSDAHLAVEAGRLLVGQGRRAPGIALLRRSLRLRPHQPEVREQLRHLEQRDGDFEAPWRRTVAEVVAAAGKGTGVDELLSHQRVTRLFPDGTTVTWIQEIVRTGRAGAESRSWNVPFDPGRQAVTIISAVRHRGKEILEDASLSEVTLSEAWYGLYYDQRAAVVRFAEPDAGDVFVVEYRISDFGRNLYGGTYGDLVPMQGDLLRREVRLVWLAPKEHPLQVRVLGGPAAAPDVTETAEARVTTVRALELPPIHAESRMPGYSEVGRYAHATTFTGWSDVGRWYAKLIARQVRTTAAVTQLARSLTRNATGAAEKLAALYAFVAQQIRYVGLEFGEHGFKPYAVGDILARRFGDCKDKASLLKAMLGAVGVESDMVLVRTRPNGRVDAAVASAAVFDHAIIYVPSLDRYVDSTARYNGFEELPVQDQGASALIVSDRGDRFVTLPESRAADNRLDRELTVRVRPDRSAHVDITVTAAGLVAPNLRKRYSVAAKQRKLLEEEGNAEYPGSRLGAFTFDQIDALGEPVRLRYALDVPAGRDPHVLRLLPAGFTLVRLFAGAPVRRHPLLLDHPFVWRWRYHVETAGAGTIPPAPARQVESRFGRVSLTTAPDPRGGVELVLEVQIGVRRVTAQDYEAFRAFLRRGDEVLAQLAALQVTDAR